MSKKISDWQKKNRKSSTVQSVILLISGFDGLKDAEKWIEKNGFKNNKVDMNEKSYRFRQLPPTKFKPKSFRTKKLSRRVSIVVGLLK
jgi:hypothetical protein